MSYFTIKTNFFPSQHIDIHRYVAKYARPAVAWSLRKFRLCPPDGDALTRWHLGGTSSTQGRPQAFWLSK